MLTAGKASSKLVGGVARSPAPPQIDEAGSKYEQSFDKRHEIPQVSKEKEMIDELEQMHHEFVLDSKSKRSVSKKFQEDRKQYLNKNGSPNNIHGNFNNHGRNFVQYLDDVIPSNYVPILS